MRKYLNKIMYLRVRHHLNILRSKEYQVSKFEAPFDLEDQTKCHRPITTTLLCLVCICFSVFTPMPKITFHIPEGRMEILDGNVSQQLIGQ